jgi:hypothetical protein
MLILYSWVKNNSMSKLNFFKKFENGCFAEIIEYFVKKTGLKTNLDFSHSIFLPSCQVS